MARPLRIDFPGAVHHVTSRGNRRDDIFRDDGDRARFLSVVAQAMRRFDACALAYCLMGNHYHLVARTATGSLSALVRHVNSVYAQAFNRRHDKVGHLFQGRFDARIVDTDVYLLEVTRYVELNPVRAGLVDSPSQWPWSSYAAQVGAHVAPPWLDLELVRATLLGRRPATMAERERAAGHYAALVASAPDIGGLIDEASTQLYIGDDAFAERVRALADERRLACREIPRAHRRPPADPLARPASVLHWIAREPCRRAALRAAHIEGGLTMTAIARELGLSVARVSQLIREAELRDSGSGLKCLSP
jgi:REP element-mobilizing transposase RayT